MHTLKKNLPTQEEYIQEQAFQKMRKARSELVLAHPFFGSLALRLNLKCDSDCRDLWTDGQTLAFNPLYACMLSTEQMIGAQAHEVMHLACGHHVRRQGRDEDLWNKACDYAINDILFEAGFKLPDNYRHEPLYQNMSVDDIYTTLLNLYEQELHGGAENSHAEAGADTGEDGSLGGLDSKGDELEQNDNKNSKDKEENDGNEEGQDQKNKAVNQDELGEGKKSLQNTSASFYGEVKDHPLLSENNNEDIQRQIEQEANINLAQAIQSAPHMGDIPLGLLRLYKQQLRPDLDWKSLLQRFIENCNDGDYSWSQPNRRYIYQDIYLPSRREPRIPYIALAIDASGSVDKDVLAKFCSELESILEAYDSSLIVLYHDTKVQDHALYRREDRPLRLTPRGGGGTDFRSIPEFLEKENYHPACLLWFTDMECDLFPEEPPYPVLWISSSKNAPSPPFGEYITMDI